MREKGVSILSSKRTEDLCETGVTTEISTCVRLSMGLPTTLDMMMVIMVMMVMMVMMVTV